MDLGIGRRCLDVCLALLGLLLTAPILAVAVLAIYLEDGGPALFRQERIGRNRRPFTILKLRTMSSGCGGSDITGLTDRRVTRVGGFLRRSAIDELPQLVNILLGDMTLVGPRPETTALASRYAPDCQWILEHTPGLTGPSQIYVPPVVPAAASGSPGVDPEQWYFETIVRDRVRYEAAFLAEASLRATIKFLVLTAVFLVHGRRPLTG